MDYIVRKWIEAPLFQASNGGLFAQLCQRRETEWRRFSHLAACLHSPFLFEHMVEAVNLLQAVIQKRGKVLIHGDYDADGLTATAVLYHFLRQFPLQLSTYIPNRLEEGYGLSDGGVALAIDQKIDLVITVDCGSTSHAYVRTLRAAGVAVIITDHHQCQETLPSANAVLNPQWKEERYPFRELSGAGVAFKFVQAAAESLAHQLDITELLDLVAIGTIADLMPLVGENRYLVQLALQKWHTSPCRAGIAALLHLPSVQVLPSMTVDQVSFQLAPKINAAGRMGDNRPALDLLLTADFTKAQQYAGQLFALNDKRRTVEAEVLLQARQKIWETERAEGSNLLLIAGKGWHHGVLGIVAARMMNEFCRSTFILGDDEADGHLFWVGSGRALSGFNLLEALQTVEPILYRFGGHKQAAGLQVTNENLLKLSEAVLQNLPYQEAEESEVLLECDLTLHFADCTLENYADLQKLQPFGKANEEPKFAFRDCEIVQMRAVGKENKHLQFVLQDKTGLRLKAIAFQAAFYLQLLRVGQTIDVLGILQLNHWQGAQSIQLRIEALYPSVLRTREVLPSGELICLKPETTDRLPAFILQDEAKMQQLFALLYRTLQSLLQQEMTLVDPLLLTTVLEPFLDALPSVELLLKLLNVFSESAILKTKTWRYGNRHLIGLGLNQAVQHRPKLSQTSAYRALFD